MKKIILILGLFLSSILSADYYSVQQTQVVKDTNTITNKWYNRGDYYLGVSSWIVQAKDIPCYTILRATGVVETINISATNGNILNLINTNFTSALSTITTLYNTKFITTMIYPTTSFVTFYDTSERLRIGNNIGLTGQAGMDLRAGSLYIGGTLRFVSDGTMRATAGGTATPAFSFSSDTDTGFSDTGSNNQIQTVLGGVVYGTFTATNFDIVSGNKIDGVDISTQFAQVAIDTTTLYGIIQSTRTDLLSVIASSYTTNRTSITNLETSTGTIQILGTLPQRTLVGNFNLSSSSGNTIIMGSGISLSSTGVLSAASFGGTAGKIFYPTKSMSSDISNYKLALSTPSNGVETSSTVVFGALASNTSSHIISFITPIGHPNDLSLPAGTAYRYINSNVSGGSCRVITELLKRTVGGVETLLRTGASDIIANTVAGLTIVTYSDSNSYSLNASDRIVFKWWVEKVSGGAAASLTIYTEGTSRVSYIQTTLPTGTDIFVQLSGDTMTGDLNSAYKIIGSTIGDTNSKLYGDGSSLSGLASGGVMLKSVYDTGNNGIVDNSEKLSLRTYDTFVDTYTNQTICGAKTFEGEHIYISSAGLLGGSILDLNYDGYNANFNITKTGVDTTVSVNAFSFGFGTTSPYYISNDEWYSPRFVVIISTTEPYEIQAGTTATQYNFSVSTNGTVNLYNHTILNLDYNNSGIVSTHTAQTITGQKTFTPTTIFSTISVSGDIYSAERFDYYTTSTITGWSSRTGKIMVKKIGKRVFVDFYISGTSDDTRIIFTLPYVLTNDTGLYLEMPINGYDETVAGVWGFGEISPNSATVQIWPSFAKGNWKNSGTKYAYGQFNYECQ